MRAWLTAVTALLTSACFHPSLQEGAPCSDGACPTGLSCVDAVCVLPDSAAGGSPVGGGGDGGDDQPAPGTVDRDADGTLDRDDNCPTVANADQHDEDRDTLGDVCDNCPALANAQQDNGDGDQVGDACDPRPQAAGETIDLFVAFNGAPLPDQLVAQTGTWVQDGDGYTLSAIAQGDLALTGIRDRSTVEIRGTILGRNTDYLRLVVKGGINQTTHHSCGYNDLAQENAYRNALIEQWDNMVGTQLAGILNTASRLQDEPFLIRAGFDATDKNVRCTTVDARGSVSLGANAPALTSGTMAIRSLGLRYRLDYLFVVGRR